jgi:hypothetical protein
VRLRAAWARGGGGGWQIFRRLRISRAALTVVCRAAVELCGGSLLHFPGAHYCGGSPKKPKKPSPKREGIGATELTFAFQPGLLQRALACGPLVADTAGAGSLMLVLQVALPCMLFLPTPPPCVELRGGTNATMAPPIDFFQNILQPILLRHCGVSIDVDLVRRGFFPEGGGIVKVALGTDQPIPGMSGQVGASNPSVSGSRAATLTDTGAGEDNWIDHNKN